MPLDATRFREHLVSGEPFVVAIEGAPRRFGTLDEWSAAFGELWRGKPVMWQRRLAPADLRAYEQWSATSQVGFGNFAEVRERFPRSYLSLVGNEPSSNEIIRRVFDHPPFVPRDTISPWPMWMFAGGRGAGVDEHIDQTGCVCTWSYMVFGAKHWWFRSPPGAHHPERRLEAVQRARDMVFWCTGYHHQTSIESAESLDVHGYVNLARSFDTYAHNLSHCAETAAADPSLAPHPSWVAEIRAAAEACHSMELEGHGASRLRTLGVAWSQSGLLALVVGLAVACWLAGCCSSQRHSPRTKPE